MRRVIFMDKYIAASEQDFINEMRIWILKGKYLLEVITFINTTDNKKIVAIPRYVDFEEFLFIDDKEYLNYQTALQRVGSLMDKADIKEYQLIYKSTHPMSFPYFNEGMQANTGINNPYSEESDEYFEWQEGNSYQ